MSAFQAIDIYILFLNVLNYEWFRIGWQVVDNKRVFAEIMKTIFFLSKEWTKSAEVTNKFCGLALLNR